MVKLIIFILFCLPIAAVVAFEVNYHYEHNNVEYEYSPLGFIVQEHIPEAYNTARAAVGDEFWLENIEWIFHQPAIFAIAAIFIPLGLIAVLLVHLSGVDKPDYGGTAVEGKESLRGKLGMEKKIKYKRK